MRHPIRRALPALLLFGHVASQSACMPGDEDAGGTVRPVGAPQAADTVAAGADAAAPGADMGGDHPVVSTEGMAPVRIGMTLRELMPHLAAGTDTAALAECDYVRVAGAPDSVAFMVVAGRLERIDVRGGPTATAEGARIGDPERRIETLYPVLRRLPHKYTDGFYLIAFPASAPDTLHRYVFETDGERVTEYRAGRYPAVEYVEGCS